jgi:hypothetical protein
LVVVIAQFGGGKRADEAACRDIGLDQGKRSQRDAEAVDGGLKLQIGVVAPAERTEKACAVFYTGTIGAGAISPALYGVLGDAVGVPSALTVVAAMVLLTLPITLLLRPALAPSAPAP